MQGNEVRIIIEVDGKRYSKGVIAKDEEIDSYGRNTQVLTIYNLFQNSFPHILNIINKRSADDDTSYKIKCDLFKNYPCGYSAYAKEETIK